MAEPSENMDAPMDVPGGMSLVVVYKTTPGYADHIIDVLQENNIDPVVLDTPNLISMFTSMGTYRMRIAVTRAQEKEALEIITKEEALSAKRAHELGKAANLALFKAFLLYVGACLIFYTYYGKWEMVYFLWAFCLTILILAVYRVYTERSGDIFKKRRKD